MRTTIALFMAILMCLPAMSRRTHRHHAPLHRNYVIRYDQKIEHDTLHAPVTVADSIIYEASRHLGKPYIFGARGPHVFDCSGFTSYVYNQLGFKIGCTSRDQFMQGVRINNESVHKGDLIFFSGQNESGGIGHVGIVFDVDPEERTFRFIHAASSTGVRIDKYPDARYFSHRFRGLRRIVDYDDEPLDPDAAFFRYTQGEMLPHTPPPAPMVEKSHKVKKGETLYSIARKYGVSAENVRKWNHLGRKTALRPGQNIIIRKRGAQTAHVDTSATELIEPDKRFVYNHKITVNEGQNIYDISNEYGCTVRQIHRWNNLCPGDSLYPGMELVIRPGKQNDTQVGSNEIVHTVMPSESIYRIAKHYNCTIADIRRWNPQLAEDMVQPGEKITIRKKRKTRNGKAHITQPGETLDSIAAIYGTTSDLLKEINYMQTSEIRQGQIIKVAPGLSGYLAMKTFKDPDKSMDEAQREEKAKENAKQNVQAEINVLGALPLIPLEEENAPNDSTGSITAAQQRTHTVARGENIHTIARRYHVRAQQIHDWNNLASYRVKEGMTLVIKDRNERPANAGATPGGRIHTVAKGENLYRIALRYDCTPQDLMKWNNMHSIRLQIGQKLKVKNN